MKSNEFERLVDWVEGKLPEAEAASVAALVAAGDEETRAIVAWLQGFRQLSRETILLPPQSMRQHLVGRFRQWAEARRQPGLWQRLAASLSFDSQLQLGMAGARATGIAPPPRQLIYRSEAGDVTLDVQPGDDGDEVIVSGQVFPDSDAEMGAFSVQLIQDTIVVEMARADELNEFRFQAVPPGRYDLSLKGQSVEIMLEDVDLSVASNE